VRAETTDGAIHMRGLFARAEVVTGTGAVTLEVPLAATRLRVQSTREPGSVELAEGFKFSRHASGKKEEPSWSLTDKLNEEHVTYGRNEPALIHFHWSLEQALGLTAATRRA